MPIVFAPQAAKARADALEAQAKREAERLKAAEEEKARLNARPVFTALSEFRNLPSPPPLRLVSRRGSKAYTVVSVDKNLTATLLEVGAKGAAVFKFTARFTPALEAQYAPDWGVKSTPKA